MYKHAAAIIRDQAKSRPSSVQQARHNIAIARITNHTTHAGKMLQYTEHAAHGDVVLPPLLAGKEAGDEDASHHHHQHHHHQQQQQPTPKVQVVLERSRSQGLRRSASSGLAKYDVNGKRTLDKERMANTIQRVTDATNEATPDWEKQLDKRSRILRRSQSQKRVERYNNTHEMILALERKLKYAMMSAHQGVDSDTMEVRMSLTTRDLLPFYQISDLRNFLDIFHRVDDDFSGDLNVDEWLQFFSSFNKSITVSQARRMFVKMDEDTDGFLSLRDLIPVIFSRASKEQVSLILKYLEAEVCQKKANKREYVLKDDLDTMFAYYDVDLIGFVEVKKIKDKIRSFQMTDQAHLAIFAMFKGYEDDEMLNQSEYTKLFTPYILRNIPKPTETSTAVNGGSSGSNGNSNGNSKSNSSSGTKERDVTFSETSGSIASTS
jgi:hypothetical protein